MILHPEIIFFLVSLPLTMSVMFYNIMSIALYIYMCVCVYVWDVIIFRFAREPLAENDWWTHWYTLACYQCYRYIFYRRGYRRPLEKRLKNCRQAGVLYYVRFGLQMTLRHFEQLSYMCIIRTPLPSFTQYTEYNSTYVLRSYFFYKVVSVKCLDVLLWFYLGKSFYWCVFK